MTDTRSDPYDLSRFTEAQVDSFEAALSELRAGLKQTHWMWFIFPQVAGLGFSSTARRYAIQSRKEADSYLAHSILGFRLEICAEALLAVEGRSARQIMGDPDYLKLQSSMTLFSEISGRGSVFERVLQKYYGGTKDPKTIDFLRREIERQAEPGATDNPDDAQ